MQNRNICVKCSADGELLLKRKAAGRLLAVYVLHPLQQKLWHPVCEGAEFPLPVVLIQMRGLFCSPGKREGDKNGSEKN